MATSRKNRDFLIDTSLAAVFGAGVAAQGLGLFSVLAGGATPRQAMGHFGVLWPIGILFSLGITPWIWLVHGPSRLRLRLVLESAKRRFRILLAGPFLALAWVVLGYLALGSFTLFPERPGASAVSFAVAAALVLLGGSSALEELATTLSRSVSRPSLFVAALGAVLGFALPMFVLVAVGETSGAGGWLALFGVLKRPEISYRLLGEAVVFALGIYGFGLAGRGLGTRSFRAVVAASSVGAGIAGFLAAKNFSIEDAAWLERRGGLGALTFAQAARLTDRDHDGDSHAFGGGDCDDANPKIHSGAVDVPENGVDEDCSGRDATAAKKPAAEAAPKSEAKIVKRAENVLLLTVDTMRGDVSERVAPNLARLGREGLVYERATSLASYTSKSLSPMMIGRYPSETARTFEHFDRFSPEVPWIQERLQKAGLRTVSVQGYWYFFFKGYGFERGFDLVDSSAAPKVVAVEGDGTSNGDKVGSALVARLGELAAAGKRFFLWGHWVDPHSEYVMHSEFDFGTGSRERYESEVAFVDAQIGRVLAELEGTGLADKTLVIVTSDHGEAFGEHGMIRHGFEVWEELVHVPLVLRGPGITPARIGARRSTIDVAPTILEALEVPFETSGKDFVRGVSLLGDTGTAERAVLVDMPEGPHNKERRAFYSGSFKLVTSKGRALGLFDLAKDPAEKLDLKQDSALLTRVLDEQNAFLANLEPRAATK